MFFAKVLILTTVVVASSGSAIPIWELLAHEEKMGRLMYVFMHLVNQYCIDSDIPDCKKVLSLYGMSNLLAESDHGLNKLDPYQSNAKTLIWEKIMKGDFKIPQQKIYDEDQLQRIDDYDSINEIDSNSIYEEFPKHSSPNDPHPYAIRVPAPSNYLSSTTTPKTTTETTTKEPEISEYEVDPYEQYLASRDQRHAASYPYEVTVLPPNYKPVGLQSSGDFEPIMSETNRVDSTKTRSPFVQIYPSRPQSSNPWIRVAAPRFRSSIFSQRLS